MRRQVTMFEMELLYPARDTTIHASLCFLNTCQEDSLQYAERSLIVFRMDI